MLPALPYWQFSDQSSPLVSVYFDFCFQQFIVFARSSHFQNLEQTWQSRITPDFIKSLSIALLTRSVFTVLVTIRLLGWPAFCLQPTPHQSCQMSETAILLTYPATGVTISNLFLLSLAFLRSCCESDKIIADGRNMICEHVAFAEDIKDFWKHWTMKH